LSIAITVNIKASLPKLKICSVSTDLFFQVWIRSIGVIFLNEAFGSLQNYSAIKTFDKDIY